MTQLSINKHIVILTGAGISSESGLSTFRANGGLWQNYKIEEVASPKAFQDTPELVHAFYNERRRQLLKECIKPNSGHFTIAQMEREWKANFTLITQNVDNLHERAGNKNLIHMHGELLKVRCNKCNAVHKWSGDLSVQNKCPSCAANFLRPDIVWFGEEVRHLAEITKALKECEIFLAVGTSGFVYPANEFATIASNATKIEFNVSETVVSEYYDSVITGPASLTLGQWYQGIIS